MSVVGPVVSWGFSGPDLIDRNKSGKPATLVQLADTLKKKEKGIKILFHWMPDGHLPRHETSEATLSKSRIRSPCTPQNAYKVNARWATLLHTTSLGPHLSLICCFTVCFSGWSYAGQPGQPRNTPLWFVLSVSADNSIIICQRAQVPC